MKAMTPGDGTTPLEAAREYLGRGYAPIPVPHRSKKPIVVGWPELRLTTDTVAGSFRSTRSNVGILTGEPSGGLADVDLDVPEAVALAPALLPATESVFGRPSKPCSHWLYVCDPLVPTEQLEDVDGKMLVELRSTGIQTVFPPSMHEEGEPIRWQSDGDPLAIDGRALLGRVRRLAAACSLARHWPAEGGRHRASLALVGGLLRDGWTEEAVADFLLAVSHAAGDDEAQDRVANVRTTAARLAAEGKATGWPSLAELLPQGDEIVTKVRDWLGLRDGVPRIVFDAPTPRFIATEQQFPEPIADEAYHGLLGDTARAHREREEG